MTKQDILAIGEMSDSLRESGAKAFELWKENYLRWKEDGNTIESVKTIEVWAESQTRAKRGFYRIHRCKEDDEVLSAPQWNPNLGFHYHSYVEKQDRNGNELSLEDINKAEFVCINMVLDYLDEEYKSLIGASGLAMKLKGTLELPPKTGLKKTQNGGISQMQQALYTFYLQEGDYLPKFQIHPKGKQQAIKEHCIILRFGWESFRNRYNKIEQKSKRTNLQSFLSDMEVVLPLLQEYPKAYKMATQEMNEAYQRNTKPV